MLIRDITYENLFTEEMVTKTYHFHVSEAELVENGIENLQAELESVGKAQTSDEVGKVVRRFIKMAYGVRQNDEFVKSEEIWNSFANSPAYNALFMELITDDQKAFEFIKGIFPRKVVREAEKSQEFRNLDPTRNRPSPEAPSLPAPPTQ